MTIPIRPRRREQPPALITLPMIGGMLGLASALLVACLLWALLAKPSDGSVSGLPASSLTMIPAPTSTPPPPPTATPDPLLDTTPTAAPGALAIGAYVQIKGTEGKGLRLRAEAGLSAPVRFTGYEDEVFLVRDGPRQADGYTWWYLVAPYEPARAGWAAADYLAVIPPP